MSAPVSMVRSARESWSLSDLARLLDAARTTTDARRPRRDPQPGTAPVARADGARSARTKPAARNAQGLNGRDGHILERAGMGGERARRYGRTCSGSAEPSVKATWRAAGDSWPRIRHFPKRPRRAFPEGNHAFYGLATRPRHSSPRCRARARWRRRW